MGSYASRQIPPRGPTQYPVKLLLSFATHWPMPTLGFEDRHVNVAEALTVPVAPCPVAVTVIGPPAAKHVATPLAVMVATEESDVVHCTATPVSVTGA